MKNCDTSAIWDAFTTAPVRGSFQTLKLELTVNEILVCVMFGQVEVN